MKKRTIYLPDWLDEEIERVAEQQMRSFSAQIAFVLAGEYRRHRSPYHLSYTFGPSPQQNPIDDEGNAIFL